MGDRRKRQTYTASPAEPGGLPVMLVAGGNLSMTNCVYPVSTFSLRQEGGFKTASDIISLQRVAS
jgi:hypothetical protein